MIVGIEDAEGRSGSGPRRRWTVNRRVKRAIDVVLALAGLVALAPLMAGIAMAIRVTMGRPVLFRQLRPGYRAEPFELVKFRSMREQLGADGQPLQANLRVTRLGYLLRRTSLDELPELWNILKGQMSVVGPRPLLMEYLPLYTAEQARRHEVRPGLTGLAQIKGRHLLNWEDRFALDIWYIDHWSLRLDLMVMKQTVGQVILGKGLPPRSAPDYAFLGSTRSEHSIDDRDE
jgi:lipopolysaccharide/colanic/teichoic acid biosynthesis glycosyltransferase